jgi:VIT1/CCC1 family predicted Fe2+/Mn2+ transporter
MIQFHHTFLFDWSCGFVDRKRNFFFYQLISGAISMGVGGYLASEAERDHFKYLQKTTKERVARSCSGEMEREVHEVLGPMGLDESISRTVAEALLRAESEADECIDRTAEPAEESTARWLLRCLGRQPKQIDGGNHQLRWAEDIGITPFLLKFGEGLEEVPESRLYISALTIGLSYFIGGLVPMVRSAVSFDTPLFWGPWD